MKNAGVISLGCVKNRVDTERLLGCLKAAGLRLTADPAECDVIIINTCGFITPAKEESIDTILEMAQYKESGRCALLVVTGCLSQRYPKELAASLPEIDLMWGVKDQAGLTLEICRRLGCEPGIWHGSLPGRTLTTPDYSAYLRVSDGCDNCCSYCAIPLIRGKKTSVPIEMAVKEAEELARSGVRELTVIAQDTSGYGTDLYGAPALSRLLKRLAQIDELRWIRVLYTYPDTVTEELIDTIIGNGKLLRYIDMPIQHINDSILKQMNRRGGRGDIERILRYIRSAAPDFIIRTTAIVGFPSETEAQFDELMAFFREYPVDRLGAFTYSPEDDTPAASMSGHLSEEIKNDRLDRLMRQQKRISLTLNKKRIGSVCEALVERLDTGVACARTYAEAPDADGKLYIRTSGAALKPGDFVSARVTDASEYDIGGVLA